MRNKLESEADATTAQILAVLTDGTQKTQIVDLDGDVLDLWHTGDLYTAAADHGIMLLARSGETPNRYRPLRIETAGADGESNTNDRLCAEAYGAMYNGSTWDRVRGDTTSGLWANVKAIALDKDTGLTTATTLRVIKAFNDDWITLRANYSAAQTDTAIVTAGVSERIVVKKVSVMVDKACSVDVAARIGFGATNTPTTTGVVLSHPGLAAGSGVVEFQGDDGVVGAAGDDLRITSEVATGGSIDVVVVYKIV